MDAQKFLDKFKEALEIEQHQPLSLMDNFQDLEDWDSLALLSVIALLDEEYNFQIESEDLERLNTIQDLVNAIESKP